MIAVTEAQFQQQVTDLARTAGWRVYHTYRSTRSPSGFPDLTMVHPLAGIVVFAELKVGKNRPTPAQWQWLTDLGMVGNGRHVGAYFWTPSDWPRIQAVLVGRHLDT